MPQAPQFVVNLNGNHPNDMVKDFTKLVEATTELRLALAGVAANSLHGRNYQTLERPVVARNEDIETVAAFGRQLNAITQWAEASVARICEQAGVEND